jgi:hypothetical protein
MSTDPVDPVDPLLARARAWTALCGACDADLPMSCTCPIGDPRQVIADLVNRLAAPRLAAPHVYAVQPRTDGTWGTFCIDCSEARQDYVWPCAAPNRPIPPARLIPAGETPALNDLYAMGDDDDAYNAAMKDVADMATTGHVPPPTSEPRNII